MKRKKRTAMVTLTKAELDAIVRYIKAEEKIYGDSYNTPGKNDWEQFFRANHPKEYEIFVAARSAAYRIKK